MLIRRRRRFLIVLLISLVLIILFLTSVTIKQFSGKVEKQPILQKVIIHFHHCLYYDHN